MPALRCRDPADRRIADDGPGINELAQILRARRLRPAVNRFFIAQKQRERQEVLRGSARCCLALNSSRSPVKHPRSVRTNENSSCPRDLFSAQRRCFFRGLPAELKRSGLRRLRRDELGGLEGGGRSLWPWTGTRDSAGPAGGLGIPRARVCKFIRWWGQIHRDTDLGGIYHLETVPQLPAGGRQSSGRCVRQSGRRREGRSHGYSQ